MKANITITTLLFLSAVSAPPVLANYFHNPHLNIMRNIGSAPSPTPRDIRENNLPQLNQAEPAQTRDGTTSSANGVSKPLETAQIHAEEQNR